MQLREADGSGVDCGAKGRANSGIRADEVKHGSTVHLYLLHQKGTFMTRKLSFTRCAACLGVLAVLTLPSRAGASAFAYYCDQVFSGTSPAASAPWVSLLFEDVTPGTVRLTISNSGLSDTEFVSGVYFNFNPGQLYCE